MNDLEETSLIDRGDTENPFKGRTRVGARPDWRKGEAKMMPVSVFRLPVTDKTKKSSLGMSLGLSLTNLKRSGGRASYVDNLK